MEKISTVCFLIVILPFWAVAQEDVTVKGKVIDRATMAPIPVVRISSSFQRVSTNDQGEFTIQAKKGDTLTFVHLSYQTHSIVVSEENSPFQMVQLKVRWLALLLAGLMTRSQAPALVAW